MVLLGELFPNFEADTTEGRVKFHDWLAGSWGVLFSHPADFTPVCTTELGAAAQLAPEFAKRGVKMMAVSCDPVSAHNAWLDDIKAYNKLSGRFPYPIVADESRSLAVQLGMLDPAEKDAAGLALTARAVFVIGPDNRLKLSILYPATTGRNFNEILRVIDSLQLTAQKKVATPVNWQAGGKCMVLPSVSEDDANKMFPAGVEVCAVPSGKRYLRLTPQPQ